MKKFFLILILLIIGFNIYSLDTGLIIPDEFDYKIKEQPVNKKLHWILPLADKQYNELIKIILKNNYDLKILFERIEQTDYFYKMQKSYSKPEVKLQYDFTRRKTNYIGFDFAGGISSSTYNSMDILLSSSWEFDLWKKIKSNIQAAFYSKKQALSLLRDAQFSLIGQITKLYYEAKFLEKIIDINERILYLSEELITLKEDEYRKGLISYEQYITSKINTNQIKEKINNLKNQRKDIDYNIRILSGNKSDIIKVNKNEIFLLNSTPAKIPAAVLENRFDIRALAEDINKKQSDYKASDKLYLPDIFLTSSAGRNSEELKDLLKGDFSVWSLGFQVISKIYDAGRTKSNRKLKKHILLESKLNYVKQALIALEEINKTLKNIVNQQKNLNLKEENADLKENIYKDNLDAYKKGLVSIDKVYMSEISLLEAVEQLTQDKLNILLNKASLYIMFGLEKNDPVNKILKGADKLK